MALPVIPVGTAMAGAAGLNFLGDLFGGSDVPEQIPSYTGFANPAQANTLNALLAAFQRGDGDFGFGGAARQGTAQLDQYLRDSGMPGARGGIADSLRAAMLGGAMTTDANNRRSYGLNLINANPQMVTYQNKDDSWGMVDAWKKKQSTNPSGQPMAQSGNPFAGFWG